MAEVVPPRRVPPVAATANVWTAENEISSDGQIHEINLPRLLSDQQLTGRYVKISGEFQLHGVFKWNPHLPAYPGITQDPFDQGQLYYSLDGVFDYLNGLGFNMAAVLGGKHGGKTHPIVAFANKVPDLNAWYAEDEDTLTFGRGDEKLHTAQDGDISVHESGHMFLDHDNPGLGGRFAEEGGAIHEGFGDALASLYYDDPEMSETLAVALGSAPSKTNGLRLMNNHLSLGDTSETTEVHDRGRVYAGFFWSLKERLGLPSRNSADIMLKVLKNHAANYRTTRPKPQDFVEAVIHGIRALDAAGKLEVPRESLEALVMNEAFERGMVPAAPPVQNDVPLLSAAQVIREFGGNSVVALEVMTKTPFIGGENEIHQQLYKTKKFGAVPILGRDLIVHKDQNGAMTSVSTRDMRKMKAGEIDESTPVDSRAALQAVQTNVRAEMTRIRLRLSTLPVKSPTMIEEIKVRQEMQMSGHILEKCAEVLRTAVPQPRLVIEPDGTNLVYDYSLGYAHFYVDAKTGTVAFHPSVFY